MFFLLCAFGIFSTSLSAQSVLTTIDHPDVMKRYDASFSSPLSFNSILKKIHLQSGWKTPNTLKASNDEMMKYEESYGLLKHKINSDMDELISEMGIDVEKDILKTYYPKYALSEEGKSLRINGNVTRVFDTNWISSSKGFFTLSGIVNRIDRKSYVGGCGEVRFLYRLAYKFRKDKLYSSRIPFTINVIFQYPDDGQGCSSIVKLWSDTNSLPEKIFDQGGAKFLQLETNFQAARFPSDLERVKGRKFAGQAIYMMRVFEAEGSGFKVKKLENTPHVNSLIAQNKQTELRQWIVSNLSAIDTGVYQLPQDFSAEVALSYSTLGSTRNANKPYNYLLSPDEAQEIVSAFKAKGGILKTINSGEALRDRLNSFTCMGCHQTSSVAGFHFLGRDRNDLDGDNISHPTDGNRLGQAGSPHFYADLMRRQAYIERLMKNQVPPEFRPHPSAPKADWTGDLPIYKNVNNGQTCFLNGHYKDQWGCKDPGASCQIFGQQKGMKIITGLCAPTNRKNLTTGLACLSAVIDSEKPSLESILGYNVKSFNDRISAEQSVYNLPSTDALNCRPGHIGVPLGRLYRKCSEAEKKLGLNRPNEAEICAIVGGKSFEEMAKGQYDSDKYAAGVTRGMLDACDSKRFCREDYICQELPDFLSNDRFFVNKKNVSALKESGVGFCTPTYFVFQLRLDGHPSP